MAAGLGDARARGAAAAAEPPSANVEEQMDALDAHVDALVRCAPRAQHASLDVIWLSACGDDVLPDPACAPGVACYNALCRARDGFGRMRLTLVSPAHDGPCARAWASVLPTMRRLPLSALGRALSAALAGSLAFRAPIGLPSACTSGADGARGVPECRFTIDDDLAAAAPPPPVTPDHELRALSAVLDCRRATLRLVHATPHPGALPVHLLHPLRLRVTPRAPPASAAADGSPGEGSWFERWCTRPTSGLTRRPPAADGAAPAPAAGASGADAICSPPAVGAACTAAAAAQCTPTAAEPPHALPPLLLLRASLDRTAPLLDGGSAGASAARAAVPAPVSRYLLLYRCATDEHVRAQWLLPQAHLHALVRALYSVRSPELCAQDDSGSAAAGATTAGGAWAALDAPHALPAPACDGAVVGAPSARRARTLSPGANADCSDADGCSSPPAAPSGATPASAGAAAAAAAASAAAAAPSGLSPAVPARADAWLSSAAQQAEAAVRSLPRLPVSPKSAQRWLEAATGPGWLARRGAKRARDENGPARPASTPPPPAVASARIFHGQELAACASGTLDACSSAPCGAQMAGAASSSLPAAPHAAAAHAGAIAPLRATRGTVLARAARELSSALVADERQLRAALEAERAALRARCAPAGGDAVGARAAGQKRSRGASAPPGGAARAPPLRTAAAARWPSASHPAAQMVRPGERGRTVARMGRGGPATAAPPPPVPTFADAAAAWSAEPARGGARLPQPANGERDGSSTGVPPRAARHLAPRRVVLPRAERRAPELHAADATTAPACAPRGGQRAHSPHPARPAADAQRWLGSPGESPPLRPTREAGQPPDAGPAEPPRFAAAPPLLHGDGPPPVRSPPPPLWPVAEPLPGSHPQEPLSGCGQPPGLSEALAPPIAPDWRSADALPVSLRAPPPALACGRESAAPASAQPAQPVFALDAADAAAEPPAAADGRSGQCSPLAEPIQQLLEWGQLPSSEERRRAAACAQGRMGGAAAASEAAAVALPIVPKAASAAAPGTADVGSAADGAAPAADATIAPCAGAADADAALALRAECKPRRALASAFEPARRAHGGGHSSCSDSADESAPPLSAPRRSGEAGAAAIGGPADGEAARARDALRELVKQTVRRAIHGSPQLSTQAECAPRRPRAARSSRSARVPCAHTRRVRRARAAATGHAAPPCTRTYARSRTGMLASCSAGPTVRARACAGRARRAARLLRLRQAPNSSARRRTPPRRRAAQGQPLPTRHGHPPGWSARSRCSPSL